MGHHRTADSAQPSGRPAGPLRGRKPRHVEIQLTNDASIGFRELDYYVGYYRLFGQHVQQTVLYAGREPLNMPSFFSTASTRHEFTILNLREMDGTELLESDDWADNEFALLTKTDPEKVIRVVFDKLRTLSGEEQGTAAYTFAVLGGIIGVEDELTRRFRSEMIDIMDNKIIGPAIRQGLEQGRQEGRQEGLQEGRQGMARMFQNLLEKRFGSLPSWAKAKLASASAETLEAWSLRLDESSRLEQLLS